MHNLGRTCWLVDGFEEEVVVVGVTFIKLYLERSLFGETVSEPSTGVTSLFNRSVLS